MAHKIEKGVMPLCLEVLVMLEMCAHMIKGLQ